MNPRSRQANAFQSMGPPMKPSLVKFDSSASRNPTRFLVASRPQSFQSKGLSAKEQLVQRGYSVFGFPMSSCAAQKSSAHFSQYAGLSTVQPPENVQPRLEFGQSLPQGGDHLYQRPHYHPLQQYPYESSMLSSGTPTYRAQHTQSLPPESEIHYGNSSNSVNDRGDKPASEADLDLMFPHGTVPFPSRKKQDKLQEIRNRLASQQQGREHNSGYPTYPLLDSGREQTPAPLGPRVANRPGRTPSKAISPPNRQKRDQKTVDPIDPSDGALSNANQKKPTQSRKRQATVNEPTGLAAKRRLNASKFVNVSSNTDIPTEDKAGDGDESVRDGSSYKHSESSRGKAVNIQPACKAENLVRMIRTMKGDFHERMENFTRIDEIIGLSMEMDERANMILQDYNIHVLNGLLVDMYARRVVADNDLWEQQEHMMDAN
ncbi:hypothetical protein BJ170DRAFT_593123 [Xylariales sp. AK1849]|nr:hypothetical protein BJ170DRAFT_593123 [Xylariales sp. AK1849]